MKKRLLFSLITILFCLSSCQPALQPGVNATATAVLSLTSTEGPSAGSKPTASQQRTVKATFTATSSPTSTEVPSATVVTSFANTTHSPMVVPATPDITNIVQQADVRFQDLTKVSSNLDFNLIESLWFNGATTWPAPYADTAHKILELGMNPGLGIRGLHTQGITGKGVNVAIIDQNLVLDHPEFKGKIVKYTDVGTGQPANQGSMHGPAVTSLLVGENIGTAPDARVYYAAAPSWTGDAQYYADALNWIVDENAKLPAGSKIRVVSVSAAPSGPGTPFKLHNDAWDSAYARATGAGILVLDCTENHGITAPCYLDLNDPDNEGKCTPGFPGKENQVMPGSISIPTSFRSTAEEYNQGIFSYQYAGLGGLSWSVPYLAGVLAMGWQIRPSLTNSQILDLIFSSAYKAPDGSLIINPVAFIEKVQSTK